MKYLEYIQTICLLLICIKLTIIPFLKYIYKDISNYIRITFKWQDTMYTSSLTTDPIIVTLYKGIKLYLFNKKIFTIIFSKKVIKQDWCGNPYTNN